MESLQIDYCGPFPADEEGNTQVLTVIDTFTRAVGLYAVKDLEAKHTARCLLRHIGIFGCPSHIVTDRGVQFTSNIITEVMALIGTDHVLTMTASKEENTAAEAANKRFQHFLRDMLFDRRIVSNWSDVLPLVQRIMMVEKNETIGMAPAQLLFGNLIHLDRGILLPNVPTTRDDKEFMLSAWAARMFENQRVLLDIAQKRQQARDAGHLATSPANPTTFPIGTYVLVTQATGILGAKPPTKLHPRLMGPFVIVNSIKDTYTCRNLVTEDNEDFHVSRLREFHFQEEFVNPKEVAMRDNEEFVVESIQEHRGDITKLTSLEFRVRWLGYDATHDTWEPWKGLRATEKLHRYLIANNLQRMVPRKFQENYPLALPQFAQGVATPIGPSLTQGKHRNGKTRRSVRFMGLHGIGNARQVAKTVRIRR